MAAQRAARSLFTFLVVLAVVGSLIVAPVAAGGDGVDGDDGVTGDDVTVGSDDTNVSVGASGGIALGGNIDGTAVDCTVDGTTSDPTKVCRTDTASNTDAGKTDGARADAERTSERRVAGSPDVAETDDEHPLPVNYSDLPLGTVPVDLCETPDKPEEVPDVPPAPDPVPQVPVNPNNPPSPPLGLCDIFNPYEPPFDPTNPPADPYYHSGGKTNDSETKRAFRYVGAGTGEGGPSVQVYAAAADGDFGTAGTVSVIVYDGEKPYSVTSSSVKSGDREGWSDATVHAVGKTGGANIVCNGEYCKVTGDGTPALGLPRIPVNNSDDGGDDDRSFPCQPPVDPTEQVPEIPDPPEQVPDVPVNPNNPPNAPLGVCDIYNPNDPPVNTSDPDPGTPTVDQGGSSENEDATRAYRFFTVESGVGPSVTVYGGAGEGDFGRATNVMVVANDGQKNYVFDGSVLARDGPRNGTYDLGTRVFRRHAGINVECDGSACQVTGEGTPALGLPAIPVNNSDDGGDDARRFPCQPPVDPTEQVPEIPDPPEQVPDVPVNPNNPPNAPIGICEVYDPNDPPVNASDPDPGSPSASHSSSRSTGDTVRYVQIARADTGVGQSATLLVAAGDGDFGTASSVYLVANDGQKDYVVTASGYDPNDLNRSSSNVYVRAFGRAGGAAITCDGENCTLTVSGTPALGIPSFPAPPNTGQDDGSTSGDAGTGAETSADDSTADSTTDVAAAVDTIATTPDVASVPVVFDGTVDAADAATALIAFSE